MGNIVCKNCKKEFKQMDYKCPHCGTLKPPYDEDIPYTSFLEVKDAFIRKHLPDIQSYLDRVLDKELHERILMQAYFFTTLSWAHHPDIPRRTPSLGEVTKDLIKVYRRYYNVHRKGLMPPGTVRLAEDPTYQNFRNRMKLVVKDFHIKTDLDK